MTPVVLVTAMGEADGARAVAAALACAAAAGEAAPLLIDVDGRPPRQTLIASTSAQRLEDRLASHLPGLRPAARGQFCQLAVGTDPDGLAAAAAAATVARGAAVVVHLDQGRFRELVEGGAGPRPTGVMLRADVGANRAPLGLLAGELIGMGLAVGVVKRRLGWVAERCALFGVAAPGAPPGLPGRLVGRMLGGIA